MELANGLGTQARDTDIEGISKGMGIGRIVPFIPAREPEVHRAGLSGEGEGREDREAGCGEMIEIHTGAFLENEDGGHERSLLPLFNDFRFEINRIEINRLLHLSRDTLLQTL